MVDAARRTDASRRDRRTRSDRIASLSSLDLRLLRIVSEHRVATQTQLELLVEDIPARTLRYRAARLHRLGLVGRSRPYRERGSAPHHFWPTRHGDALARGAPPPRGGERSEPNPTFIGHAAAVTGFYVALARRLAHGVRLACFVREAEAREQFQGRDGRRRAIAPEARVELEDKQGRRLVGRYFRAFEQGTMPERACASRIAGLTQRLEGLRARREELAVEGRSQRSRSRTRTSAHSRRTSAR